MGTDPLCLGSPPACVESCPLRRGRVKAKRACRELLVVCVSARPDVAVDSATSAMTKDLQPSQQGTSPSGDGEKFECFVKSDMEQSTSVLLQGTEQRDKIASEPQDGNVEVRRRGGKGGGARQHP
jgi:hypothetical protein